MNIRCPHCQTVFRVNPTRIPASGVRAKCARCGDTFMVTPAAAGPQAPPAAASAPAPAASAPSAAASAAPPAATTHAAPAPGPIGAAASAAADARPAARAPVTTTASPAPTPTAPSPAPPAPSAAPPEASLRAAAAPAKAVAPAAAASASVPSFRPRDPSARAARLARALVSDIVAYHPQRRDRSLEQGTLRTEFREEIMKSWDEYVAQVGVDVAKSTPYFRDALNTILARGQKLF